eukprot:15456680-Alexandrium_andersonii.AAC.1
MTDKNLVHIGLDRRWADYFNNCDTFYVDKQHFSFKASQMAHRDNYDSLPIPARRYRPVVVPYSKSDTPQASK